MLFLIRVPIRYYPLNRTDPTFTYSEFHVESEVLPTLDLIKNLMKNQSGWVNVNNALLEAVAPNKDVLESISSSEGETVLLGKIDKLPVVAIRINPFKLD